MKRDETNRVLFDFLRVAALLLVIFVFIELVASRIIFQTQRVRRSSLGSWTENPVLGVVRANNILKGEHGEFLRTNSLGFRGGPISLTKTPGTYRVLITGGSVIEGFNFPEEKTIPVLLEAILNRHYGGSPKIEVGNLSYPAISSAHSLNQIANRLLNLDPDLIFELDAADFFRWLHPAYEPSLAYMTPPLQVKSKQGRKLDLVNWMRNASSAVALISTWQERKATEDERIAAYRVKRRSVPFRDPPADLWGKGLPDVSRILHRAAVLCKDANVTFSIATQAWLYKDAMTPEEDQSLWVSYSNASVRAGNWNPTPKVARAMLDLYNDTIRDVAIQEHALLVDLAVGVPSELKYFQDDVHPTEAGNNLIANLIADAFIKSRVIDQKGGLSK